MLPFHHAQCRTPLDSLREVNRDDTINRPTKPAPTMLQASPACLSLPSSVMPCGRARHGLLIALSTAILV